MTRKLFASVAIVILLGGIVPCAQAENVPKGIYYTINDGTNFFRSSNPFRDGVATQSQNPRHITLSISNETGYADSGFVLYVGKLADITSIVVKGRGDPFNLNFWFDTNKDGQFFAWNGNTYTRGGIDTLTALAGDGYASDNSGSANGTLSVTDDTSFYFMTAPYGIYSLSQIKGGAISGIDGDTIVAIWVGVSGANRIARIDSVIINRR